MPKTVYASPEWEGTESFGDLLQHGRQNAQQNAHNNCPRAYVPEEDYPRTRPLLPSGPKPNVFAYPYCSSKLFEQGWVYW